MSVPEDRATLALRVAGIEVEYRQIDLPLELGMVPVRHAAECFDYGFALGQRDAVAQIRAGTPVAANDPGRCARCGGTIPTCCRCPEAVDD